MSSLIEIVFWSSVLLMAHSYLVYPMLLRIMAAVKAGTGEVTCDDLPGITVITAAYNEEKTISRKLQSLMDAEYPAGRLEILIGSDASTDSTDQMVREFSSKFPAVQLIRFEKRTGKSPIINQLVRRATNPVIVFTDANVIFGRDTLYHLAKHFTMKRTGLVGANIVNSGLKKSGISFQEKTYIEMENRIKYLEGKIWGSSMGAFGACYAIRKELIPEVPASFLMEDFYITMHVIKNNYCAFHDLKAICYEDVSTDLSEEFRRKVRISAGNFQNLSVFYPMALKVWTGAGFSFVSHKVIRWFGPFFMAASLWASAYLSISSPLYYYLFLLQAAALIIPFIDFILGKSGIHVKIFRFVTHFFAMNLALLYGFFSYIKGVKTNIWTPTSRNV